MFAAAPRGAEAYRQTQVVAGTPLELVVMLYDGALRFMAAAHEAVGRGDVAARRTALSKALAIIGELQNTLNMEHGGEIAAALDDLYRYTSLRLLDAAAQNDQAPIDEAMRLFRTLRDGWQGIAAAVDSGGRP